MHTLLVVEHEPGAPLDRLENWLPDAARSRGNELAINTWRPYKGEPVPELLDVDALLVLGGQQGAYDDEVWPWLPVTRALLATCVYEEIPMLGICLGAQLLAAATGGKVEVGANGIEAGVVDARWRAAAADDPLVRGLPDPFPGPSMHRDAVTVLPPDAVWLAGTATYPYQAFRVGRCAWGVQFHPEVSRETFQAWADNHERNGDWTRWGMDGSAPVAEFIARDREIAAAGEFLADRIVAVLLQIAPQPST